MGIRQKSTRKRAPEKVNGVVSVGQVRKEGSRVSNLWGSLTFNTLGVLGVQVVLSQVKLSNLDCWGPGESVGTQYVEFQ